MKTAVTVTTSISAVIPGKRLHSFSLLAMYNLHAMEAGLVKQEMRDAAASAIEQRKGDFDPQDMCLSMVQKMQERMPMLVRAEAHSEKGVGVVASE